MLCGYVQSIYFLLGFELSGAEMFLRMSILFMAEVGETDNWAHLRDINGCLHSQRQSCPRKFFLLSSRDVCVKWD